jgi:hypothetical protein
MPDQSPFLYFFTFIPFILFPLCLTYYTLFRVHKNCLSKPGVFDLVLEKAVEDCHYSVRKCAVEELAKGWLERPETLKMIRDRLLNDDDNFIRIKAVQELAKG